MSTKYENLKSTGKVKELRQLAPSQFLNFNRTCLGGSWGLVCPRASWSHAPSTPGLPQVGAEVKSLIFHLGGFKPINKQPCFSLGASLLFQPLRLIPKSHILWSLLFPPAKLLQFERMHFHCQCSNSELKLHAQKEKT